MKKTMILLGVIFMTILLSTISFALGTTEVKYEYDEENNKVIAQIISNVELKDTKPTWTLSEDKKIYTKEFYSNINYTTQVEDIDGNIIDIEVQVTQVKKAQISVEYEYNEEEKTVVAKIISDVELQSTKPTWELSEDKKIYTKIFSENMNYETSVIDVYGNEINVTINVNQIKRAKLSVKYEYNETENTVVAKIVSDKELKDTKPTWEISEDKKIYTKIYNQNGNYTTDVVDMYDNVITVEIKINSIDYQAPIITFDYRYNNNDTVTIFLKSNERLGNTKPTWRLSEDGLTYEKDFSTNEDYTTTVQDIHGNSVTVPIKLKKKQVTYPQPDKSNIVVRYIYTSYDNVIVQIVSTIQMQDTKPTWELTEGGFTYTKVFDKDQDYVTTIQDIHGMKKDVTIQFDFYFRIIYETGTYGISGAKIRGVSGGSDLEYYRFGNGENVLFATFCVHGYEDGWDRDGTVLVDIANNFYNRLVSDQDINLAKKWTIYIFKEVNPDGRRLGTTNNGPGRTTLYSKATKGIDINRCWQTGSNYKTYTSARYYNGKTGFQAYEAEYLRDFLLSHKSQTGQTVLVDLHGWQEQLIGDAEICKYYKDQYTTCRTTGYGRYGTQYLITWARQNLGAKVSLVELPVANNYAEVSSMKLSDKYINATLNMLKGI